MNIHEVLRKLTYSHHDFRTEFARRLLASTHPFHCSPIRIASRWTSRKNGLLGNKQKMLFGLEKARFDPVSCHRCAPLEVQKSFEFRLCSSPANNNNENAREKSRKTKLWCWTKHQHPHNTEMRKRAKEYTLTLARTQRRKKKYGMMIRDCDYIICAALFEYGSAEADQSKTQKVHFYKLSRVRCELPASPCSALAFCSRSLLSVSGMHAIHIRMYSNLFLMQL